MKLRIELSGRVGQPKCGPPKPAIDSHGLTAVPFMLLSSRSDHDREPAFVLSTETANNISYVPFIVLSTENRGNISYVPFFEAASIKALPIHGFGKTSGLRSTFALQCRILAT